MAGAAQLKVQLDLTGLGDAVRLQNDVALTVPVQYQTGYTVLANATSAALQLFALTDHFALNKIIGVYLKAVVGTVYYQFDTAGTTTFGASGAHGTLNVGEAAFLPIEPTNNAGFTVDGSAATAAIVWAILAKT